MLKFITGNKTKFTEAQKVLAPLEIERVDIDLMEIQALDAREIIRHKLKEAFKHHKGEFIVEDTSMYLECLDYKLPGPFIKWFNDTVGTYGIYNLTKKMGKNRAKSTTIIGYAKSPTNILFFEGNATGTVVAPRGKYNFGYDPIFVPTGSKQTLSELKSQGIFKQSPRGKAVKKLKGYLLKNGYEKIR